MTVVSQLDKCLKFKSVQGDKSDLFLYKITSQNAVKFRHLLSGGSTAASFGAFFSTVVTVFERLRCFVKFLHCVPM